MIEIKLPDWVEDRNIHIMAGTEIIMKRELGTWYRKTERCNLCGKCCMNVPKEWPHGQGEDGHCSHLTFDGKSYLCDLGFNVPLACAVGDGTNWDKLNEGDCSVIWEKLDI